MIRSKDKGIDEAKTEEENYDTDLPYTATLNKKRNVQRWIAKLFPWVAILGMIGMFGVVLYNQNKLSQREQEIGEKNITIAKVEAEKIALGEGMKKYKEDVDEYQIPKAVKEAIKKYEKETLPKVVERVKEETKRRYEKYILPKKIKEAKKPLEEELARVEEREHKREKCLDGVVVAVYNNDRAALDQLSNDCIHDYDKISDIQKIKVIEEMIKELTDGEREIGDTEIKEAKGAKE